MNRSMLSLVCSAALLGALAAPAASALDHASANRANTNSAAESAKALPFTATEVARFNEPWAMTFLPDGRLLVTEKRGVLKLQTIGGSVRTVTGVPAVAYGGQGGLGDVILHPQYATNRYVYISYAERGSTTGTAGAAVARARLNIGSTSASLSELRVIWRQPKVSGSNHYGHRLAFGPDRKLWITSSERQKFDPAQDLNSSLGKVIRLNDDGSVPTDNPFYGRGGVAATVWSYGHRNLLGIAFDAQSKLWIHEMGPKGGDELNLIERGSNYGWPLVSQGDHYDGTPIPRHSTRPDLNAPEAWWTPVIAPAGFIIYSGTRFPAWAGNGLIGGLASQALIRVRFSGSTAAEAERYPMGKRIREVEQGPNGDVWVLEDGTGARLLRLTPL
ncbi:PQQ-dependent sugar dehydrogenase [Lysobacter sp. 1R34A]|uniref:PQQ-dependent sugar dehydrogenase n=1 Tax=Lysobacter sp. 1R34A TaxID=3445786 RepID=UPI003EEEC79F